MAYREIFVKLISLKKYIKFFVAGSLAAFTNLFFLYIFHGLFHINVVVAASLSFVLAFIVSFFLQKLWTFSDISKNNLASQLFRYFLVAMLGLTLNAAGIYVLVEMYAIWYLLAQAILALAMSIVNFLFYKIIFNDPKSRQVDLIGAKKILIASGIYVPDSGGPATYSHILKNEFSKRGFEIKVLTYAEDDQDDDKSGIYKVSRKRNLVSRYFRYFKKVIMLSSWADLVYVQGPVSEGLPSYLACRLKRKRYILKVVGDFAWEQGVQRHDIVESLDEFQNKNYSWKVELWRMIEVLVANGAHRVITPSEYLKNVVAMWGINKENIKVIYNSANVARVDEDKEALKNKLALNAKVLLSASRLVPWKGFSTLIQVVGELKEEIDDLHLYIAGAGPMEDELKKLIYDLGLAQEVRLLGQLDRGDLWRYMKASDAFVLNTSYEGLSHLLIEAMNMNLPIITSNVGGNPELIKNRHSGVLFEYDNKEQIKAAIRDLYSSPDVFVAYAREAKSTLGRFSKDKMLGDLEEFIKSL